MKLYTHHRAPNPRRVRWLMAEKGIDDVQIVEVDIFAGEHKTPAYREKAGLAHVPALELDDGVTITESIAICRYLEAKYPEPNLLGRSAGAVMTLAPSTIRPGILAAEALRIMNAKKITSLFVVGDSKRPEGILHLHDCLRAGVA